MALTYTQLVALVRTWCNRDDEVVSDAIIQDSLKYAADKAYRTLRVPPLENVAIYEKTLLDAATTTAGTTPSITEIQLPYDLIEFIQLKEKDSAGVTLRVFNEKLDVRTFNDHYAEKYIDYNYWTRERNVILFSPGFGQSGTSSDASTVELFYYRRLPALDAKYAVTVLNYNAGFLTTTGGTTYLYFTTAGGVTGTTAYATQAEAIAAATGNITAKVNVAVSSSATITNDNRSGTVVVGQELSGTGVVANTTTGAPPKVTNVSNQNSIVVDTPQTLGDNVDITFSNTTATKYIGTATPNWLRDENERILLFGALAEVFSFCQEDDQAAKYQAMFMNEIRELNDEDAKRNASGGNVQVQFNGRGLI
jgi:hypothetical protein